ncbi:MAG: glutathione peroxidase [Pedobacter sp.]|nr:glutathione peroxidase [Chitinophagaceae bacterium]
MTLKQQLLKQLYKLIMLKGKLFPSAFDTQKNELQVAGLQSFYDLTTTANNGSAINFAEFKGKKIIIVNTASNCGYTAQYDELETLYRQYKNKLVVLAFPANDFQNQERGNDDTIAQFCRLNYGISFPLMQKSSVVKGDNQNPIFKWLSDDSYNGWCHQQPTWNFCKYIVDENGNLTHFFSQNISPLSKIFIEAIEN